VTLVAALLTGCQKEEQVKPDYNRALPPGASALRLLLSTDQWPDLQEPFAQQDSELIDALERSGQWFDKASSRNFFPMRDVTHFRAQASVYALRSLLQESASPEAFQQSLFDQFNCYTSVGYDDKGTVLYTGYYTPVFRGGQTRTSAYPYPLHKKPGDLVVEPLTGKVLGRQTGAGYEPYPTRSEIESSGMLDGLELVYVASRLDQYIIHVNGSAKIELDSGETMYVGYAGNNGHEYTGLGKTLLEEGAIEPERLGLPAIRAHFRGKDQELERYINMNDRFVFFTEYDGGNWPAGSLGFKVAPMRSLATDKSVFPRAGLVIVQTRVPTPAGSQRVFNQFMMDQDTGGAIRAAGRGDIYMGIGPEAEQIAGRQFAEGRLFYFFLKHEHVNAWAEKMRAEKAVKKEVAQVDAGS
jgi:membrane-bound lytic murein transglycosylase A